MTDREPMASGMVDVAATPARVYELITDLAALTELAEETARMRWVDGEAARPGAVFKGTNRNGWRRWTTTCTVTDAAPGQRFAFEVSYCGVPIARWQYDLAASERGCRVSESAWDRRPAWFKLPGGVYTGALDRAAANARHIRATLHRLKARAEATR